MTTATAQPERVLFVDDEPHLLAGIQRALRNHFSICTAKSGAEGLRVLETSGPFAVVVSDMRMPEMTGVQFLAQVRERYPDAVRMIFSGEADLQATIAAVNEGNIFRFLSKPISPEHLATAVKACLEQHRLMAAEKVLLEQTLSGSVSMMVELLSFVMPAAHGRALRLHRYVLALAAALNLHEQWQWPLAALVSQIGCVSLTVEALSKVEAGQELSPEEQRLYDSHPEMASKLLESIPRLEDVAAIVTAQHGPLPEGLDPEPGNWDVRTAGRILLRAAHEFDACVLKGLSPDQAVAALRDGAVRFPESILIALQNLPATGRERVMRQVRVLDLAPGMMLDEALLTNKGACLVPAGQEVTSPLILRLRSISAAVQFQEPFRVQVPV